MLDAVAEEDDNHIKEREVDPDPSDNEAEGVLPINDF